MPGRPLSDRATAAIIAALGAGVALAGDACHVASGTTEYRWDGFPTVWRSALWFPVLVATAVLLAAWAADRSPLPAARARRRADVPAGVAAVLALYALTAVLRDQPTTVSVTLTAALAALTWAVWDPSAGALLTAAAAAVAGPAAEIGIVHIGAARYGAGVDGLGGVAPWLPCLYFAAGAVAARLWAAIARDGEAPVRPR